MVTNILYFTIIAGSMIITTSLLLSIISAMLASIREDEVLVNGEAERIIKAGYEFVGEELKKIAGLYIEIR